MTKNTKKVTNKSSYDLKFFLLIIGFCLVVFSSVLLFTRPAYWEIFDLTQTGQIGDTIGGITAPIINIIGAILIYISFKAQIKANEVQYSLFNEELENQKFDRNFQVTLDLFQTLKEDYRNLSYDNFDSQSAINAYVNDIRDNWDKDFFIDHTKIPIYGHWKFLLSEYDLISYHIETANFRKGERKKLYIVINNFYSTHLSYPTKILKKNLQKFDLNSDVLGIVKSVEEFNSDLISAK